MLYICLLHIGTIINIYRYAPKKIYALQEHSNESNGTNGYFMAFVSFKSIFQKNDRY